MSKKLPHKEENCCLSADEDYQMYAVGSRSHTDLLDSRSLQVMIVRNRRLRMQFCGVVEWLGNSPAEFGVDSSSLLTDVMV